jgi:peptide/nickel transport system substrate-binding protein
MTAVIALTTTASAPLAPARNVARGRAGVLVLTEPTSLDPLVAGQIATTRIVSEHVFESLVRADPFELQAFVARPALAESWTVSPDGTTWTFALRRGVEWHDGRPFGAADVIATMERMRQGGEFVAYFADLARWSAPDEHTVVLEWERPYFMAAPALSLLPIEPAHVDAATLERTPIGTGPWKLAEWIAGERITLEHNPRHWGAGARLERIDFRFARTPDEARRLLDTGEIDVITAHVSELEVEAEARNFSRVEIDENAMSWLGWNNEHGPFRDVRVRRAMAHAVEWDPQSIEGRDRRTCFFVPRPGAADDPCDAAAGPLPFDPGRANRLLDEAGLARRGNAPRLTFELVTTDAMDHHPALSRLRAILGTLGVVMRVRALSWADLLRRLRAGDFDACLLTWFEPVAATDPAQVFRSGAQDNLVRFRHREADALMDRARGTLDDSARAALFRQLTVVLASEQPVTLLDGQSRAALVSPRIADVHPTVRGYRYEDWRLAQ